MVEWKKLGEVFNLRNGYTPSTKNPEYWNGGIIPWFRMEDIRQNGNILNDSLLHITDKGLKKSGLFPANSIIVATSATIGEHALLQVEALSNQRFTNLYPKTYWIDKICMKFAHYYMFIIDEWCKTHTNNGGFSSVDMKGFSKILIPIPPLSEQNRIVGILDTFTESIENLKKQISERKKQYEHYRDQLLDLEGKPGVEMMSMGELFTFKNGLNKGKEFFGSGKPIIMFSNVFNSRYLKSSMITNRVDITKKEMERIDAKIGDVFFTRTSETREDVGYSSVLLEDIGECTFAGFLIRARPLTDKLIPSYCKYCFSSPIIRCSIIGNSSFTTRASLTGSGLGKIDLPIPPLSQQSRIVSILDTFEASIANLEQQLTHRQKQYEYYRNMLLTFDE